MSATTRTDGSGGEIHSFCAMNSLSMSFWIVPPSFAHGDAAALARSRGTSRAGRDALQFTVIEVVTSSSGMRSKRRSMSSIVDTATPSRPTSPRDARVVGVVAHQGGHVEGRRQAVLSLTEQEVEALVGVLGRAEAGELAHRPAAAQVHARVRAAQERIGARLAGSPRRVLGTEDRLQRQARVRGALPVLGSERFAIRASRSVLGCHVAS